ncbi:hypothetical protein [Chelatococcus composti]|uniref:HTH araC/xylS-type domain-containing protein n=1 Tax=Chelatococcus composti TaxID=1743235 RepID=A0A841KC58_9HYPH|nr:hypothetical protein [Chelatococcus composti]MBB6169875.1 hypothetical protein [Chelatococcus composti]MBS7737191.1 hypothetical protein [Chelatococcus composti]GGG50701.1 hypothetical protein GCM10008026_34900 [Chelatococcus composti]
MQMRLVMVTNDWLERSPDLSLDALSRTFGIGRRYLQRIILDGYGAMPKTLAVKYRALRAAAMMAVERHGIDARACAGLCRPVPPLPELPLHRFAARRFPAGPGGPAARTRTGRYRAGAARPLALWS